MRDNKSQKFPAYLTYHLFVSDAFRALKPSAKDILILFCFEIDYLQRRKRNKKGKSVMTNRQDIRLPYNEIQARLGYSTRTIWAAIKDMLAYGFIKIVKYGGGAKGDVTVYGITEDWRTWRPGKVVRKMRKNGGVGWQKVKK